MYNLILAAAGSGKRMQKGKNKLLIEIHGKTLLEICLRNWLEIKEIQKIILLSSKEDYDIFLKILDDIKTHKIVLALGGKTRKESVLSGLKLIDKNLEFTMISDAARVFINRTDFDKLHHARYKAKAVIPYLSQKETSYLEIDGLMKLIDRERLKRVITPQLFHKEAIDTIIKIYTESDINYTDESSAYFSKKNDLFFVELSEMLFKITEPNDLNIAKTIIQRENEVRDV